VTLLQAIGAYSRLGVAPSVLKEYRVFLMHAVKQ
jgi:hypothetical protein